MATPTIADYLKYANLQMAAEAFLVDENGALKTNIKQALVEGNHHASYFPESEATTFNNEWQVLAQCPNTPTGFSGTLFENRTTHELVISFRSTEFIDDAIRDSAATNTLEVHDTGFAWGQISDMEKWYADLKLAGKIPSGSRLNVTGYSLGGHLATAFNLLHQSELNGGQVITFNGAGVGQVKSGGLQTAIDYFNILRDRPAQVKADVNITLTGLSTFYDELHQKLTDKTWTAAQGLAALNALRAQYVGAFQVFDTQAQPLVKALNDIIGLQAEATRIKSFTSGGTTNTSIKVVQDADILAETLDYRLAVYLASQRTVGATILGDAFQISERKDGSPLRDNQYDVVGMETTTPAWSAVAYSQLHYGENVSVFIEDQPFTRGGFTENFVKGLWPSGEIQLLQDKYDVNNFSDNHSLVLLVDSLAVQNVLYTLDKSLTPGKLTDILKAASNLKAQSGSDNGGQGLCEGDVLENMVDALGKILGLYKQGGWLEMAPSNDGNTWWDKDQRDALYKDLKIINDFTANNNLAGKVTIELSTAELGTQAKSDFSALVSLLTLSPIVLKGSSALLEGALGAAWGDTFTQWQSDVELTSAQRAAGQAHFSDAYLTDRAAMLSWKVLFNNKNLVTTLTNPHEDVLMKQWQYFKDTASGEEIVLGKPPAGQDDRRQILFGSDEGETLAGLGKDDRLYGGGGNDTVDGSGETADLEEIKTMAANDGEFRPSQRRVAA